MNKFEALRHFCTLAETLSFKETANRLAISPQVVSRMIADLEALLGEMLFKRNTRNIKLTPFGEQFLPQAQQLLAESEKLFTPHKAKENEMKGMVRITVPPLLPYQPVLKALLAELAAYPDITLDWRVDMHTADYIEEQIDIGLRIGLDPDPNFIIKPIGSMEEIIVASPMLIAKTGLPQQLNELADYPVSGLVNLKTGRMWNWFISTEVQFVPKQPRFITNDSQSELLACLAGHCFSLLPRSVCEPYLASKQLQVVFPELQMQQWQLYLYRPYQTITPPRVLKVFEILENILKR